MEKIQATEPILVAVLFAHANPGSIESCHSGGVLQHIHMNVKGTLQGGKNSPYSKCTPFMSFLISVFSFLAAIQKHRPVFQNTVFFLWVI